MTSEILDKRQPLSNSSAPLSSSNDMLLGVTPSGVPVRLNPTQHPLQHGQVFYSPGGHFCYRVIGPCCRLFDREELPWPCCRLQWRGKEPSWRRVGKRFTPDLSTLRSPSYSVEVIGQEQSNRTFVLTFYSVKLPKPLQEWWHSKKLDSATTAPPTPAFCLDSTARTDQSAS